MIGKATHLAMRRATEVQYGEISDKIAPGAAYVELLAEMIEEGHLEGIPLTRVVTVDDGESMQQGATIDSTGVVRVRRSKQEVKEPSDPEGLRRRLRTWGFGFTYMKLKHVGRGWLQDAVPEAILDYADYLLGDQVRGLESHDDSGAVISRPSWPLILKYDLELRKKQARLINDGGTFRDSLKKACNDTALRDRHFVTPLAVQGPGAASSSGRRGRSRTPKNGKGKRAYSKGGGRGGRGGQWLSRTPDGREICYAYNSQNERCKGRCGRVHVCRRCLGRHPAHTCKGLEGEEVTGGGGPGAPPATAS